MIKCTLFDVNGDEKAAFSGAFIDTVYEGFYREGDKFKIRSDFEFVFVSLDASQKPSLIYLPEKELTYTVPFGAALNAYDRASWESSAHRIIIREASEDEAYGERNLALNSLDLEDSKRSFPHATASFVTRGDAVFKARNVVDGVICNTSHGEYPYHSWAGGAREDLTFELDFGSEVEISEIIFYLRADFPHDTY